MAFPIFSGGIRLISLKVITQIAYMGSWVLVAHVIASKFLLDLCAFLLEMIVVNKPKSFLFLIHLRLMQELLPLGATTCVPPFEQVVEKSVNCFQEIILERLHTHSFTNILSGLTS